MTIIILGLVVAAFTSMGLLITSKTRSLVNPPVEKRAQPPAADLSALMRNLRAPSGGIKEVFAFVEQGDQSVPLLIEALEDRDPRVRGLACWALGELKNSSGEVIEALAKRLSDDDHEVRASAVHSLRLIKTLPTNVVERLEVARRTDPHPTVRNNAEEALLSITGSLAEPQRSVSNLLADFESVNQLVREAAIDSIGRLGLVKSQSVANEKVLKALTDRLLHDDSFQCPQSAALSIWRIGQAPPFVIDALGAALGDTHSLVQSIAAQVLGNFGRQASAALPRLRAFAADDKAPDFQKIAQQTIDRIMSADAG